MKQMIWLLTGMLAAAHPDIADDLEIAKELTGYLKNLMGW